MVFNEEKDVFMVFPDLYEKGERDAKDLYNLQYWTLEVRPFANFVNI